MRYQFNITLAHVTLGKCCIFPFYSINTELLMLQVVLTITCTCKNGLFLHILYCTIALLYCKFLYLIILLIVAHFHAIFLLSNYVVLHFNVTQSLYIQRNGSIVWLVSFNM